MALSSSLSCPPQALAREGLQHPLALGLAEQRRSFEMDLLDGEATLILDRRAFKLGGGARQLAQLIEALLLLLQHTLLTFANQLTVAWRLRQRGGGQG